MPVLSKRRIPLAIAASLALVSFPLSGCNSSGSSDAVELTLLTGTVEATVQTAKALADAFNVANPNIKIKVDSSVPGGSEGDNLIKTRLATGDAPDLLMYNSGSLLQALNPDKTLLNVANEPWVKSLIPSYVKTVSTANGLYGAPAGRPPAAGSSTTSPPTTRSA